MNWLQKTAQPQFFPGTYTGVGHGYRWDEESDRLQETWQSPDRDPVLLWSYENGQIIEEQRMETNQPHWSDTDDARGRIETGNMRGSVTFNRRGRQSDRSYDFLRKKIIETLLAKYPEVKFGVYERGGPYTINEYWQKLESNQV